MSVKVRAGGVYWSLLEDGFQVLPRKKKQLIRKVVYLSNSSRISHRVHQHVMLYTL